MNKHRLANVYTERKGAFVLTCAPQCLSVWYGSAFLTRSF
jgi:hypothetical protein